MDPLNSNLAGSPHDSRVIDPPDKDSRQVIAAKLRVAISQDSEEQEQVRQLFLDHDFYGEATRDLKSAESPAERADAARKLGLIGNQLATAHLIAALFDSAPEVRRASAEALSRLGDPAVVTASLNALLTGDTTQEIPGEPEPTRPVAEKIKSDETASAKYAGEEAQSKARQASVAEPSGASDEATLIMEDRKSVV